MELQSQCVPAGERLVAHRAPGSQQPAAIGNFECLPVELEDVELFREPGEYSRSIRSAIEQGPSGFVHVPVYPGTVCGCDELGPEADAEDFLAGFYGPADEFLFLNEPGKFVFIVDAHGPAEKNEMSCVKAGWDFIRVV